MGECRPARHGGAHAPVAPTSTRGRTSRRSALRLSAPSHVPCAVAQHSRYSYMIVIVYFLVPVVLYVQNPSAIGHPVLAPTR